MDNARLAHCKRDREGIHNRWINFTYSLNILDITSRVAQHEYLISGSEIQRHSE